MDRKTKKALKLAIKELSEKRRKHIIYVAMAVHGFEEGYRGKKRWEEYNEAVETLEKMLEIKHDD